MNKLLKDGLAPRGVAENIGVSIQPDRDGARPRKEPDPIKIIVPGECVC